MFLQVDFINQELENLEVPILLVISYYSYNFFFSLCLNYHAGLLEVFRKVIKVKLSFDGAFEL